MTIDDITHLMVLVVGIPVWLVMLHYINQLETIGCVCAMDWRRSFIKYYIIFLIVFLFATACDLCRNLDFGPIVFTINFIISMIFVFIVYQYIHDLKVNLCTCSVGILRDMLEIINYMQIILVIFVIAQAIYTLYLIANMKLHF
jgi:hypothetical protein